MRPVNLVTVRSSSRNGSQVVVELLVDRGADVNAQGGEYSVVGYISHRVRLQIVARAPLCPAALEIPTLHVIRRQCWLAIEKIRRLVRLD